MGDFCMRLIAQIVSGCVFVIGTLVNLISKIWPVIDQSISTLAGIIGVFAGLIWLSILVTKHRKGKIELENAQLENQIKRKELENLEE